MRVLVARQDNIGDVLLAGPAVRAVAERADELVLLCGPRGRAAADMLPGVDRVIEWRAPWIDPDHVPVEQAEIDRLTGMLEGFDRALILTSFHQSPLPLALLLRLAGTPWIGGISEDYPGSLLDLRHRPDTDVPEPLRMLALVEDAGFPAPADTRLRVRGPLPDVDHLTGGPGYVVVHPGTSVPARAWPPGHCAEAVRLLVAAGRRVVVTGHKDEKDLTALVAGEDGLDLGGRTSLPELASVLRGACAAVAGNTGPAHLAAAVGTPVVSLFAPTVPAARWAPFGVPLALLGDQGAPCKDTRARDCPVDGHPCLASVGPDEVAAAVEIVATDEVAAADEEVHAR
ncbi:ADP-heptose:LPS heptosyltransferase [Actinomadura coerulea]|uniref:ADP-heptose:LPS heptosyltransferase n=1 Tax=Actinomadura coerulea TaxID=46159 RepID=A0A7X0FW28_9ACTN|nr:glycosyltransferase family 9 protein [Actinomadura coerulea]MBB6394764.1 ADP-heptose:LPS heptosyltransferase [Actinomadura coerulea]GGQ32178.1 glycosyl transferase [Actinomadura coerulea]